MCPGGGVCALGEACVCVLGEACARWGRRVYPGGGVCALGEACAVASVASGNGFPACLTLTASPSAAHNPVKTDDD